MCLLPCARCDHPTVKLSDSTQPASYTFEVPSYPQVYVAAPAQRRPYWLHILLLVTTILTTFVVGAQLQFNFFHDLPAFDIDTFGYPFLHPSGSCTTRISAQRHSVLRTLMGILLAHELGTLSWRSVMGFTRPCLISCRHRHFPIGTFGAVIRIKSPIRSRQALFDIGIAGPIAGFLVAMPVFWGLGIVQAFNVSRFEFRCQFWISSDLPFVSSAAAAGHTSPRSAERAQPPSRCYCGVGWNAGDRPQPSPRRPVRRRAHHLRDRAASAHADHPHHGSGADSLGHLVLAWLGAMGSHPRTDRPTPPWMFPSGRA